MENASKALIIAGSVLLAMLIIGTLIFMFTNLSNLKQIEADSSTVQKLEEYNRQIELYNKSGLYGSEILSLAHLIEDYNVRQAEYKGYTAITLEVYTNSISGVTNHTMKNVYNGDNAYLEIAEDFDNLTEEVNSFSSTDPKTSNANASQIYKKYGYTVREFAGMRTEQIIQVLRDKGVAIEISDISSGQINRISEYIELQNEIAKYNSKNSELTQFKRKSFQLPIVEYDEATARVKSMIFYEQGYTN